MPGRVVAFLSVVTAVWLAGVGLALADPSSTPSTSSAAVSSSPVGHPIPNLSVTFNPLCGGYGFDVTNNEAVPHTVALFLGDPTSVDGGNGVPDSAAVVVPPGATVHIPLTGPIEENPGLTVNVVAVDPGEGQRVVFSTQVPRSCEDIENISVTIPAGGTYTLAGPQFQTLFQQLPTPRHGVVTHGTTPPYGAPFLRYTPDPCFAGTDSFGYADNIEVIHGVVTVTVRPGACRITVHRSATNSATHTVSYTATNPYSLAAHLIESNSATPGTSKNLLLPAHHTGVISIITFAPATTHARVSFTVRDTAHTVLTDDITFAGQTPTSPPSTSPFVPGPGATGDTPRGDWTPIGAAILAAVVAIGALATGIVRARKPKAPRS